MKLKKILESFNTFKTESNLKLLIESRISNTEAKYPGLDRPIAERGGQTLLSVLVNNDPSNNQKYLMHSAKLLYQEIQKFSRVYKPDYGDSNTPTSFRRDVYYPWFIATDLANDIRKFHEYGSLLDQTEFSEYKDFEKIPTYGTLKDVAGAVEDLAKSKAAEKEARAKEREQIGKETIFFKTPFHTMVRPLSEESSCYFGQGTRWCVSATKSDNYFNKYTIDKVLLLFLISKRKDLTKNNEKLAISLESDRLAEFWNAKDDRLSETQFKVALRETMIGKRSNDIIELMSYLGISQVNINKEKEVRASLRELSNKLNGFKYNPRATLADLIDELDAAVDSYYVYIINLLTKSSEEKEPGPYVIENMIKQMDFKTLKFKVSDTGYLEVFYTINLNEVFTFHEFTSWIEDIEDEDREKLKEAVASAFRELEDEVEVENNGLIKVRHDKGDLLDGPDYSKYKFTKLLKKYKQLDNELSDYDSEIYQDFLSELEYVGLGEYEKFLEENKKSKIKLKLLKN